MTFEEMRVYMTRSEGNCWVGVSMADGNMAMISRFGEEQEFICDYDGYLSVTRLKLMISTRL